MQEKWKIWESMFSEKKTMEKHCTKIEVYCVVFPHPRKAKK